MTRCSVSATPIDATQDPPKSFREFIEAPHFKDLCEKLDDLERLLAD